MDSPENAHRTDAAYEKGKLYQIPLKDLLADPGQPRKVMEARDLDELTASVRKHGILEPILFRRHEDGNLIVVAGERRTAAARKAGLTYVPAIYVDGNASEIALVENLLRQDLTAVEEAEALQRLLEQQKYTHEQLSGVIGKARTTISDILLINRLPQAVRDDCRGNRNVSKNVLIEIARKKQERAMITAYNAYKERLRRGKRLHRRSGNPDGANGGAALEDMVKRTLTRLSSCDITDWEEPDKARFCDTLTNLKGWIDHFLSGAVGQADLRKEIADEAAERLP